MCSTNQKNKTTMESKKSTEVLNSSKAGTNKKGSNVGAVAGAAGVAGAVGVAAGFATETAMSANAEELVNEEVVVAPQPATEPVAESTTEPIVESEVLEPEPIAVATEIVEENVVVEPVVPEPISSTEEPVVVNQNQDVVAEQQPNIETPVLTDVPSPDDVAEAVLSGQEIDPNDIDAEEMILFDDVEMPLSKVLYDMERLGVLIDKDELIRYGKSLTEGIERLQTRIYEAAGEEFNLNSPKQLAEVLFEKMQLPGGKKTKSGYSTAADVLEKLAEEYPIVADILEYRTLAKLKSTYADGLLQCIAEDNRIHTTFKQTITATGRISSTEPNLQNIPMRMELGRKIRKAFIPKPGYVFMDADYSQIELRLLAHMSGDEQLIEAYKQDADIHRITASKVFHTPLHEVTDLQRRNAKAVNFGIVYGISSFGLSQDLSINRKEAEGYIRAYFEQYPKVKEFLDKTVADAEEDGYVTTMFGRRRPLPEILSSNFMQRSFGKRVAMNAPIQGSAADIMKIAMIRVWEELKKQNLESRILIQVHDELLLEVKEEEVEKVERILVEGMKNAADLLVDMEVDVHCGNDWYDAK